MLFVMEPILYYVMHICGSYPLITNPSRISEICATLIDSINDICNGLFMTDVTDHLPVFVLSQYSNIGLSKRTGFKCVRYRYEKCIRSFGAATDTNDRDYIVQLEVINFSTTALLTPSVIHIIRTVR